MPDREHRRNADLILDKTDHASSPVVTTPRLYTCPDCAFGIPDRSVDWLAPDTGEVSRFSRVQFLDVLMAPGLRRVQRELAIASPPVWPSR
jgi:hypothetical protein